MGRVLSLTLFWLGDCITAIFPMAKTFIAACNFYNTLFQTEALTSYILGQSSPAAPQPKSPPPPHNTLRVRNLAFRGRYVFVNKALLHQYQGTARNSKEQRPTNQW